MTEFYKLLFDLALYYTLTGFYTSLLVHLPASPVGFAALVCVLVLDVLLRCKDGRPYLRYGILLLPLCVLLARPGLWQLIQLAPAWLYLGWCILSGRVYTDHDEFRRHFGFGLKILPLVIPGLVFDRGLTATIAVIPYLTLMLACGVCLLRSLRERKAAGLRQGLYVACFLLLSLLLTVGHAPQLLVKGVWAVYSYVLVPALMLVVAGVIFALYGLYAGLRWFFSRFTGNSYRLPPLKLGDEIGVDRELERFSAHPLWLRILIIAFVAVMVAILVFLILRRLTGSRVRPPMAEPVQQREKLPGVQKRDRGPGRIRPRDPRLAVRWYFARFLAECRRRGVRLSEGMTSQELVQRCARVFPDADAEVLAALYRPARYHLTCAVTAADAKAAGEAWKQLKHSKTPD